MIDFCNLESTFLHANISELDKLNKVLSVASVKITSMSLSILQCFDILS